METAPQSFICPITGEIMADPVTTSDGFSYEREAIMQWFEAGNVTSPLTGAAVGRSQLTPNHTLRTAIQEYVNAHPEIGHDVYRPRDVSAIRQTIESKQWATPQPVGSEKSTGGTPMGMPIDSGAGMSIAVGAPVPMGVVQAPPPPPLTGLTDEDRDAAGALAVPDWVAFVAPPRKAPTGWFGMGKSPRGTPSPHPDEPRIRIVPVAQGGLGDGGMRMSAGGLAMTIEACVSSEASLLRLVRRLVASKTAPVASLRIKAEEGYGHGTLAEGFSAQGPAFALLTRALFVASGDGAPALAGLRELSITKLDTAAASATALATALHDHPTLSSLELWNCHIDDEGARRIAALAAVGGNPALRELNLGRNLVSGHCREQLEALIDRQRVHAKIY